MNRMNKLFLALLLGGVVSSSVWALDAQQVSKTLRITYEEPSTNADVGLTPLTDLSNILIKVVVDGVFLPDILHPASSPTGGQGQAVDVTIPFKPNSLVAVEAHLYAVDLNGNVSEEAQLNLTIDWLPPGKVK